MASSRRFDLELEESAQRPVGRITAPDGRTVEFDGWIALAAAIEAIHPAVAGEARPDAIRGGAR
jgi:hypothetical protein